MKEPPEHGLSDPFVEPFRARVFRYSRRMCDLPQDAEEVAQDALLQAFQNYPRLRDPACARAWVLRIVRNACLMRRRKVRRAPAIEVPIESLPAGVEPAGRERPDSTLLETELRAMLVRALLELPPRYRAVVILRDIQELSTEQTARALNLKTAVVKTRLHRGRTAMREKLGGYLRSGGG
jgi:RNA polymerase sigma-70 factor (ECF subfamily)